MSAEPTINPPRRLHLLVLLASALAGATVAGGVAALMGGEGGAMVGAAGAVVGGTLFSMWAALIGIRLKLSVWTLLVMGGGLIRIGATLGIGAGIDVATTSDRTPLWVGLMVGTMVVLAAETFMLIHVLNGHKVRDGDAKTDRSV